MGRWASIERVVTILRADSDLAGVQVSTGWPGDRNLTAEMIWVDDDEGERTYPVMVDGRKPADDVWTLSLQMRVAGQRDLDATRARLDGIVACVHTAIVETADLEGLDDVVSVGGGSLRQTVGMTPNGCLGYAAYDVEIHLRLP